jgi:K+-transporting ATPase KdpF subunit
LQVKGLDALHTGGRQERVNARQHAVKAVRRGSSGSLTGRVIENLVAALVGTALLGYLVYALVRPDRF